MKGKLLNRLAVEYSNKSRKELEFLANEKVNTYMVQIGIKKDAYAQSFDFKNLFIPL